MNIQFPASKLFVLKSILGIYLFRFLIRRQQAHEALCHVAYYHQDCEWTSGAWPALTRFTYFACC